MAKGGEFSHSYNTPFIVADPTLLYSTVPNMDEPLRRKQDYSYLPIDTTHPLHNEPLVDIANYGLAGQAYYSRPNSATIVPVPGIPPEQYLRRSVTETLAQIDEVLSLPIITDVFNGEVKLYIEDALRDVSLQQRLHDEVIPRLVREQQPDLDDAQVDDVVSSLIAVPSRNPLRPSPHATGGAFDVSLRYKDESGDVDMGHSDADTVRARPDYYEYTDEEMTAQRNRRAFHAVMTGLVFAEPTGFIVNPTEWWHYGRGDQLSEKVRGSHAAYYSIPVRE